MMADYRQIIGAWPSANLGMEMKIACFGDFGQPYLIIPPPGFDADSFADSPLMNELEPLLASGQAKVYITDNVDHNSWLARSLTVSQQLEFYRGYDRYLIEEVIPFVRHDCRAFKRPLGVIGLGLGAFHAINIACRHPDHFSDVICIEGTYKLPCHQQSTEVDSQLHYYDFQRYLPNLDDYLFLPKIQGQCEFNFFELEHRLEQPELVELIDIMDSKDMVTRVFELFEGQGSRDLVSIVAKGQGLAA